MGALLARLYIRLLTVIVPPLWWSMRLCESLVEIVGRLGGRRVGLVVGKVIKAVYWKSNMMLARLATLCEYQLLKSVDLERIAGRLRVAPRELSAAGILLQGVSGELEETTRLYNFAGELPKRMCTKLSNLDVRQGVGYDLTQDEDAVMSKMCLLSPQIARLGMRRLGTVPISTVKCFFAILRHCR